MLSTLLSLPALPLLLLRSNSSLTTSLQFLLFHLTWSSLVLSHNPLTIELAGSLLIRATFLLLPSLLLLLLDLALPALTAQWKSRGGAARKGKAGSPARALRVAAVAGGNILLATALQGALEWALVDALQRKSAVRISKTLPSPAGALWDILRAEAAREVLTYYVHRYLLHSSPARGRGRGRGGLAKAHQAWAHAEYGCAGALNAHYDHPAAYLVHRFLPVYLPAAVLLRMHVLTWFVWLAGVSVVECVGYSGLVDAPASGWVPFGFVLGWAVGRVDGHFGSGGRRGFGVWGVADWVGGTRVVVGGEEAVRGGWRRGVEWVGGAVEGGVNGKGKGRR